ncbi:HAMP domain-containing histidine kinase [Cyclobacteriaceae bacterium]|jgi:signal transduction histidine kinase|nr:HAMP domain-containing histidine kinase [Cyclobacteriaceae bacterium]|tara:strand:- start:196 stop:1416 length:1221 start_codon:yes stop_codon:yes gene_type:complete
MSRFKILNALDIYATGTIQKWIVLGLSLSIGLGSVLYTNKLVKEIKKREDWQVNLYAKALEFIANEHETNQNALFALEEIIQANTTIPVILTNENDGPVFYKNLPMADLITDPQEREYYLIQKIKKMGLNKAPIVVNLVDAQGNQYGQTMIYFEESSLLVQLRYYPYVQLAIIFVFVLIVFTVFNYSRLSEQNQIWVGMAKETAHQLGTPISSLMAWGVYFKEKYVEEPYIKELDKDVKRLEIITQRFSSIGSAPKMESLNIYEQVKSSVDYLKTRISKKVTINFTAQGAEYLSINMNPELFSWVLENLIKNAVDAMAGVGQIHITMSCLVVGKLTIDIEDQGNGIAPNKISKVFKPGFSTKNRGWGLGLTLSKRIIEDYHGGRIFIKNSTLNKGTSFRIILNTNA